MDTIAAEALGSVRAGIDALLSCGLGALAAPELTELLSGLETQRRRLEAVDQRLLATMGERGVAGEFARSTTAELMVTLLRVSPREAKARVNRSLDMGPRRELTGESLEPIFPLVAEAQQNGEISAAHASAVTTCIYSIPSAIAPEAAPIAEELLVEASRHCEPALVVRTAQTLLARLNPDGVEPSDRDIDRRRGVTLHGRRLSGELTDATAAVWRAVLDALSAPLPAEDGERDDRSPAQRRHDALHEAGLRLLRSGSLPAAGGVPVTVLVTMSASQLADATGYAQTATGEQMSAASLLEVASEAEIIPVVLDDAGGVLCFGRTLRTATCGQRRALTARDGGCSFPGCTRPPAWCQAHHVVTWLDGGATDLDNLCLLCTYHHREFERRGWTVEMPAGVPRWIPPAWIDPDRKPVRNTVHHRTEIDFGDLHALLDRDAVGVA